MTPLRVNKCDLCVKVRVTRLREGHRIEGRLANFKHLRKTRLMTTVQGAIEKKVLKWPATRRIELAEKLMASVEDFATAEIEAAWNV